MLSQHDISVLPINTSVCDSQNWGLVELASSLESLGESTARFPHCLAR
jgi:hypothetical protein